MKEPIQKYFQAGTIQWMTHPPVSYPVCDSVKAICCNLYFGALEITHIPDREERERMERMPDQSYLRVRYSAQPGLLGKGLNPNHPEETQRRKAEEVLAGAVGGTACMGTRGIASLVRKWQPDFRGQAYPQFLKTTRVVCGRAAQKSMMVELEVFDYDMNKTALIGSASLVARLAVDIRMTHHNLGLMADLSHLPTTYETSRYVAWTLRPYITHFHIGNAVAKGGCRAYGDQHPRFGFSESANGMEQLAKLFRVLKEESSFYEEEPYVLSLKVKPWGDEDGEVILANTKCVINRTWTMVED